MLVAACAAVAAASGHPAAGQGPDRRGDPAPDRGLLLPLGLAATGLGVAEAALNFIRRWVQASAVTGMEQTMRGDLYAHLQRLDVGFHDEWQSGQLLSRATTDLSAIRRFAGFGPVFLITNVVTFVAVVALLIQLNWWLGLITGGDLPAGGPGVQPVRAALPGAVPAGPGPAGRPGHLRRGGGHRDRRCSRRSAAAGRRRPRTAHRRRWSTRPSSSKARLRGAFWAMLDLIPNAVIGLILLLGAIATSQHALTLGGLVAFITLTLELVWPIEAMGYILASGQEAATAAQRVFEILDTPPAVISAPAPGAPAWASTAGGPVTEEPAAGQQGAPGGRSPGPARPTAR